jgi:hypothetical protein
MGQARAAPGKTASAAITNPVRMNFMLKSPELLLPGGLCPRTPSQSIATENEWQRE